MRLFQGNYAREAASLLRDLSVYRVLTKEQILGLYPDKKKYVEQLLPYLRNQSRIWKDGEYYCSSPDGAKEIDYELLTAVWVLIDFIDRVEFHSTGDYPAKVIFIVDGVIYEIIHAAVGRETLVTYLASTQNKERSNHLILVDKPEQIMELDIPNTCGYCTVSPNGEVHYYQKE